MISIKEAIESRENEAEAFIIAQREQTRKVMLMISVWMLLYPIEDREIAKQNLLAIFRPLKKSKKHPILYLEEIYRHNRCEENQFIDRNIDKVKVLLEYFLGYRPELEDNIPPKILTEARQKSLTSVAKEMSQSLNVKS